MQPDVSKLAQWENAIGPLASFSLAIEHLLDCRITFVPADASEFGENVARTWTQEIENKVIWPQECTFTTFEHWIFFHAEMDEEQRCSAIAHELAHIWLHVGRSPQRYVTKIGSDGTVQYDDSEEFEADLLDVPLG